MLIEIQRIRVSILVLGDFLRDRDNQVEYKILHPVTLTVKHSSLGSFVKRVILIEILNRHLLCIENDFKMTRIN